ncbi:guanine nucleotide exchange protein for ADP-robosylation factor, partial [Basidiobolus ranarum]
MSDTTTGPPSPTVSTATDISATTAASKSQLAAGALFIINALEKLQKLKEGKKNKQLTEAAIKALDVIKNHPDASICTASDSEALFLPLKIACHTGSTNLVIIAIDCIGKLITYNYIINDESTTSTFSASPKS